MVKQGSVIKINFDPSVGSEQGGYRPAVVISNNYVLSKTNIISICPITSVKKTTSHLYLRAKWECRRSRVAFGGKNEYPSNHLYIIQRQ